MSYDEFVRTIPGLQKVRGYYARSGGLETFRTVAVDSETDYVVGHVLKSRLIIFR